MLKIIILFVFVCLQVSRQENVAVDETDNGELIQKDNSPPIQSTLIAKWHEDDENTDDKPNTEWTEKDEKWLEQVQKLLEDGGEKREHRLVKELAKKWFMEVGKWSDEDDEDDSKDSDNNDSSDSNDEDDDDNNNYDDWFYQDSDPEYTQAEDTNGAPDEDNGNDYYDWTYQMNLRSPSEKHGFLFKRFSSV